MEGLSIAKYIGWKFKISKILNIKINILKLVVCLQNINDFKLKCSIVLRYSENKSEKLL